MYNSSTPYTLLFSPFSSSQYILERRRPLTRVGERAHAARPAVATATVIDNEVRIFFVKHS